MVLQYVGHNQLHIQLWIHSPEQLVDGLILALELSGGATMQETLMGSRLRLEVTDRHALHGNAACWF
jgi:hypothetical protein